MLWAKWSDQEGWFSERGLFWFSGGCGELESGGGEGGLLGEGGCKRVICGDIESL